MIEERIRSKLRGAKNILVLATGGGNDSVSSLLLIRQLQDEFEFDPEQLTVAAMLPDGVDYKDISTTGHPLLLEITPITSRWINKKKIEAFPEPLLAEYGSSMGVDRVVGLDMINGSYGVARALYRLIHTEKFDTVLALDVGGDFIAVPDNLGVMSPMMDAYALYALKGAVSSLPAVNFIFGVFGLGTDGESTPEMLDKALEQVDEVYQGTVTSNPGVNKAIKFYEEWIAPNRPSRTAALTIQAIRGFPIHRFEYEFRNRFHTEPTPGDLRTHYAIFKHVLDEEHTAKYYLFDHLWDLKNPFAISTNSSLEWFKEIQAIGDKLSHELNGQTVNHEGEKIYFGTPPWRFEGAARQQIIDEILDSIYNGMNKKVYMYNEDIKDLNISGLTATQEGKLALVTYESN